MRITLQDIADKADVSKMTVSMALRDSPRITQERRWQIQKLAREMGYIADPFLARLSNYRHQGEACRSQGTLAWLNHWPTPEKLRSYGEFEIYFCAARQAAKVLGYRLDEVVWPKDRPAKSVENGLLRRGVLGLLIPPHPKETQWEDFDWSKFSLMRFGLSVTSVDCNLVSADHQRAMVMAVCKIFDHGYRKIGLVYNREHDCSIGGNYYGGFMWACRQLGLEKIIPPLDSETRTPRLAAQSRENLKTWLQAHEPEALLTTVPEAALFLRESGYEIPRDIALAGASLNDILVDAGIDQHSEAVGRIAAEMLIKQISLNERGVPPDPSRILVESRWRDGASLPRKSLRAEI